ncbi:MAG: hypothetical protein GDA36_12350 [Rhodobacteraceae bacterium]|nr:hypothetical protein [Paracoccaceae bacterium]
MSARFTKRLVLCVTHMFNHQNRHPGQIRIMPTEADAAVLVPMLFIMREEV